MEDARIVDAARCGRIALVRSMLEAGVSVNSKNVTGETALHVACFYNRSDVLSVLLEAGASVNAVTRSRFTPLHYAADSGNLDARDLRLLLLAGSEVMARDSSGNTPLHTSARMGRVSTFKLLAEKEALESVKELSGCPTGFLTTWNSEGESPLSLARKRFGGLEFDLWTEDLLQRIKVQRMRLTYVCRHVVLLAIGETRLNNIDQLPLPNHLKGFLRHGVLEGQGQTL